MDDLLFTLFSGQYDPTPPLDQRQEDLLNRRRPYDQAIHQAFGLKFIDAYHQLWGEQQEYMAWLAFQAGVRLGGRLAVEALRPA